MAPLSSQNISFGRISMQPQRCLSISLYAASEKISFCSVVFTKLIYLQEKMEMDVEAYLKRRYESRIADIEIVGKEDLDLVSNLYHQLNMVIPYFI